MGCSGDHFALEVLHCLILAVVVLTVSGFAFSAWIEAPPADSPASVEDEEEAEVKIRVDREKALAQTVKMVIRLKTKMRRFKARKVEHAS
jgi:hypothetical protein